jgi:hypothetical protein
MSEVGEKLLELEAQGLKLEDLQSNEQFISAVMHASLAVIRTQQEAKLTALRNAIINVAIGQPLSSFQRRLESRQPTCLAWFQ